MSKAIKELFSVSEFIILLILSTVVNFFYQFFISQNIYSALFLGLIGGLLLFESIFLNNRKTNRKQLDMKELNKYASCVVLKLKSNQNVVTSIKGVIELIEGKVKGDVEVLLYGIENEQKIVSENFWKYNFSSINVFHQIIQIHYSYGGNPGELFHQILKDMAFEIKKRDELFRKKSLISLQIFFMTLIVASLPVLLKVLSSEIYRTFMILKFSQILLFLFHISLIIHIVYVQKVKNDIAIRV